MERTLSANKKQSWLLLFALIIVFGTYAAIDQFILTPKIAYVDTGKLMIGFSEAAKVDRELKAEDEKWQVQLKQLQDSLQATIDNMSKEYDKAPAAKKKEYQDILSARNQQVNNFRQANMRKMEEMRQKKMQGIFDKANVYLAEYGKQYRYNVILGTVTGGNILYGNAQKNDITEKIIKGLNERYK